MANTELHGYAESDRTVSRETRDGSAARTIDNSDAPDPGGGKRAQASVGGGGGVLSTLEPQTVVIAGRQTVSSDVVVLAVIADVPAPTPAGVRFSAVAEVQPRPVV